MQTEIEINLSNQPLIQKCLMAPYQYSFHLKTGTNTSDGSEGGSETVPCRCMEKLGIPRGGVSNHISYKGLVPANVGNMCRNINTNHPLKWKQVRPQKPKINWREATTQVMQSGGKYRRSSFRLHLGSGW